MYRNLMQFVIHRNDAAFDFAVSLACFFIKYKIDINDLFTADVD